MRIAPATKDMLPEIIDIVQTTIDEIYPKYYPVGAVAFFKELHSDKNIVSDIANGCVYYLSDNDSTVGTVTIKGNHILRLFVLREFQHKGYGQIILDFAEEKIQKRLFQNRTRCLFSCKTYIPEKGLYRCRI